jgi:hypothetical protein
MTCERVGQEGGGRGGGGGREGGHKRQDIQAAARFGAK